MGVHGKSSKVFVTVDTYPKSSHHLTSQSAPTQPKKADSPTQPKVTILDKSMPPYPLKAYSATRQPQRINTSPMPLQKIAYGVYFPKAMQSRNQVMAWMESTTLIKLCPPKTITPVFPQAVNQM